MLAARMHGLYAITPELPDSETLLRRVALALQGGIAVLQYRSKLAGVEQKMRVAKALAAMCRDHQVPFIINDDLELALESGADGVHLGRDDGELAAARARLGSRLLGASCYNSLSAARAAVAAGADYIAFGSVFPSSTKPAAVCAPLTLFGEARSLGVPLIAIGGITLQNAPQLLSAGADCLAVITDLFEAPEIAEKARAYAKLCKHDLTQ
ncbi:MAG: thiamine phosphate synthase [Betaproteobacteria bacterium]|nr:thiamine phosphate synthase [Betaproteobacteria bacterium]MSQ88118.1 thiamine phosphate synthase [Betaproteobacteria bacterium]